MYIYTFSALPHMVILPEYVTFTVMQQEKMKKKKTTTTRNKQTRNKPCTECILLAFKMCGENYCHRCHLCQLLESITTTLACYTQEFMRTYTHLCCECHPKHKFTTRIIKAHFHYRFTCKR